MVYNNILYKDILILTYHVCIGTSNHFSRDWYAINRYIGFRRHESLYYLIFCLFVSLGFIVPLENFSLIRRRHHCRWRAANFDLCSALMAIKEWGFFSVPHLLWHGASVYNDHLRGPVTLTPIAELVAVELSLPVFYDLGLPRLGILFECYIKINIHV